MSETEGTIDDGALDESTQHVIEQLMQLGPISTRRLFGTAGLFLEDRIFGLVHDGITYFRTNDATATRYVEYGSRPFMFRHADGSRTVTQFHEVPARVLDDGDEACAWAYEAAAFDL